MKKFLVAIDQGTTSSRAILFDLQGNIIFTSQFEFTQYFPKNGWVEHNPNEIWSSSIKALKGVIKKASTLKGKILSIGITNQRETTILWNKKTGKAIYNAIVWQDRRTSEFCSNLKKEGLEKEINKKTGLLLDPYFSSSKISWLLENVNGLRNLANKGDVCFGTVDSWLIWNLTNGDTFATDYTNASRTSLYNIQTLKWDDELLSIFDIPLQSLPEVRNSNDYFGETKLLSKKLKITGVIGDQQSSAFGQSCYQSGDVKSTYGTGCFLLANTGKEIIYSKKKLLTTIAYKINDDLSYALEGSIFMAGGIMNWLKLNLGILDNVSDSSKIASSVDPNSKVVLVPAFSGLGAPHWSAEARGSLFGLTRFSNKSHMARAVLESVAFQTYELLESMEKDLDTDFESLKVDGGMVANNL